MNRRRTFFVNHPTQRHYLILVAVAMFVPTIVATACLYYLIWQTVAYELAIPELIAESLLPAFHRVNQIILIVLPLLFSLIFFVSLRISHRFSGPLYRIEKDLDTMIKTGDFTKPIRLRPRDQLHSLANHINRALHAASHRK